MKRILAGSLVALALAALLVPPEVRDILLTGRWSFVKSAYVDKGYYFRLKVALIYKGDPQDFDIVVGCNARQINYKDGSSTSEVGMVPTLYGRRMKDGKGLVIRPSEFSCHGYPAPSGKEYQPLVIVFDNADELGFGTAYISSDAYESPISDLKFVDASTTRVSRADFDEFRKNGPPNLVRRAAYHARNAFGPETRKQFGMTENWLDDEWPGVGLVCQAFARFRLPQESQIAVSKFWPASRPKYWQPITEEDDERLRGEINATAGIENSDLGTTPVQRDDGGQFRRLRDFNNYSSYIGTFGVLRRDGSGLLIPREEGYVLPSYYPASDTKSAFFFPRDPAKHEAFVASLDHFENPRIEFRDGTMRGRGHCYSLHRLAFDEKAPAKPPIFEMVGRKKQVSTVDGHIVEGRTTTGRLQFYEENTHMWTIALFGIGSVGGDI